MKKIANLISVAIAFLFIYCGHPGSPDLILHNGKVFTADPSQPYTEAIAIQGERILAVGTSAEMVTLADAKTKRVDLQGHVAIPGINDAHCHFLLNPAGGYSLVFQSMEPSWQEVQDALREAGKEAPQRTWIYGTIGLTVILEPKATRFALDRIAPDHPVYLSTFYGHGDIINSNAMIALDIGEEQPDPIGGYYERVSGSNRIKGKLFEYAQWPLRLRLAKNLSDSVLTKGMQTLAEEAVRFGITTIQDMPMVPLERYTELLMKAQLPIRVRMIRFPPSTAEGRDVEYGRNLSTPPGQSMISVSGTKWILDGTPLEWGAALRGTYLDRSDWSGRLNFSEKEIASMVQESLEWEDQLLLHCAGDKPVEALFNAMENVSDVNWKQKRVRVEHGDGVTEDLINRARDLGAVVVQNPTHLSLKDIAIARYGSESQFFPLRSLHQAGIPVALGSDGPLNPYLNIMFAVVHPINPSQALTREQAVEAYTRGSAYAEFKEQEKGTITKGKLADIAVLSQDIFDVPVDALPATHSILTIVGGKIVHDANQLK
jgi:predicted amidohydrolase YtcJ